MKSEEIIAQKMSLIAWAIPLKEIPNDLLFKPFREGSWGTADVISHFISWDDFLIKNRITYLLKGESFPKIDVDPDAINKEASNYARSGISKNDLINEFISTRTELVALLGKIPAEKFNQPCPGMEHITLADYFSGLIEHDTKHKEQIEAHLE
ncbi:DinB family protein [Mesobacillus harenae]|uniref:DinB family protein n=1 Tax=Mesobacillus harenae TaxID=2213203 RepID=UPI001580BD63|nr:DinB family protein [Mesobacillus harenae]